MRQETSLLRRLSNSMQMGVRYTDSTSTYRHYNWWCSECGEQPKTMGYVGTADFMFDEFKFCNHCGAKMIGVEKLEFFDRRLNDLEDRETEK